MTILGLMDIQMPLLDGYSATKQIRQSEISLKSLSRVPIVALTAGVVAGEKERCLDAGMNGYLSKPIDQHDFVQIISELLVHAYSSSDNGGKKPDDLKHFDRDRLLRKIGGNVESFNLIIKSSKNFLQRDMSLLNKAINDQNWERVKQLSHKLKGAFANLYFNQMSMKMKEINEMKSTSGIHLLYNQAYDEYVEVVKTLQYELDNTIVSV